MAARFLGRIPGVEVTVERHEAMSRLAPHHQRLLHEEGLGDTPLVTAEQVHGNKVALVTQTLPLPLPGVDGLATRERGITLGIYVADCAPVWIVARDGSAGALLHSGKKGTELAIVSEGIRVLEELTQLPPSELILLIGPCIRPPCYELDFAAEIRRQAEMAGILEIHDDKVCTACHPDRYYSYRRERGLTGRMLATLTLLRP
jgi:copper oxidase (laccase) domain-containing protein